MHDVGQVQKIKEFPKGLPSMERIAFWRLGGQVTEAGDQWGSIEPEMGWMLRDSSVRVLITAKTKYQVELPK